MCETSRARLIAYGVAVLATGASLLLRWPLMPCLGYHAPLMTFFPAIILSAYLGGLGPGLAATFLGAAGGSYFLIAPMHAALFDERSQVFSLGLYLLAGVVISGLTESLHRSRSRIAASERRYAVTLASIGDAVIATDVHARITFLNPAAEALTGWALAEAVGRPLAEVFRIVNERTREPIEDSAALVLRLGRGLCRSGLPVLTPPDGLANLAVLLGRDGREVPIDDCAAPMIDDSGRITGVVLVFHDVTERRQAEEAAAFRRANERMELAMRGSNVGVWESESLPGDAGHAGGEWGGAPTPLRHYVNFWEQLGYEGPPGGGDPLAQLHPDDRARVEEAKRRYLAGASTEYETEARLRHKDGSYRTMLLRGAAVRDAAGKRARFVGVSLDVTQLKLAEEELRESEQRWRCLTEALPQLVWSATPDGACDYFSTQWTEHTGIAEVDLLGWRWLDTLHPDDRAPTRRFWLDSVAERHPYDVEYRVRRRDGEYRWFKTRGVPIRDVSGTIVRWFGTCTDITGLRQTEEALRQSEERFRGTFENAAVGIAHTDPSGCWLRVNKTLAEILGYTVEETLRLCWQEVTHPADMPVSVEYLNALLRGERSSYSLEKRYVRKDGSVIWGHLAVSLQRDAAGQPAYIISVIQDISERKRLEEKLRRAIEAAEAANRAKDEFLANVSHEIRTPMNAILGMTELALDTELTDDQRQCLRTVKSAADSLLGIINDLLDFAKIEAGKMELDPADFSLRTLVGDTLRVLAARAHKKGLELIYQVQSDVPDALIGDAGRLRQVLLNLVGNAIKFTEQGEVVIQVRSQGPGVRSQESGIRSQESGIRSQESGVRGQGTDRKAPADSCPLTPDSCCLVFEVQDTGIGIPPDKQERIFRAFEQEDTSTTRKYGGTGLGLTIASRLAALMSGRIRVSSEPDRGSTFTFTARFGLQPHPTEPRAGRQPVLLQRLRVLIADDNATNRHILEEWLRGWRMEPAAVGDGRAALDVLSDAGSVGRPYALLLLDAHMPDTDGLALAARIRNRAELAATRIILLTSGDRPGDLARYRAQRIDAHLLKPVQPEELLETIQQVMSRTMPDRETRRPRDPENEDRSLHSPGLPVSRSPGLRILVAEDNEFNAQLLEQLLGRRGHRVRLAHNGREALRLAELGGFDLLLLDVHMPELDGFQVAQAIREQERTTGRHLPIIALTARSRPEDRAACLAAGMDDFLAKPVQAADLAAAIDRVAALRPAVGQPGPDLLDPRVLLAACGDDAVILENICRTFRARLPDHLEVVWDALRDRDAPRLREAAHKLAGMVAAFSTTAGGVASDLEDHAARGQLDEARPLVEQLETMVPALVRLAQGLSLDTLHDQAEAAAQLE